MSVSTAGVFTKGSIQIQAERGQPMQTIDGALIHACGLGIHRETWPSGQPGLFIVTHLKSGLKLWQTATKRAARRYVVLVADFTDWKQTREQLEAAMTGYDFGRLRMLGTKAESKPEKWVLWGKHPEYAAGEPIKIKGGTLADCRRERRQRLADSRWTLAVYKVGTQPQF